MTPITVSNMILYVALAFAALVSAQQYVLQNTFAGTTFFDNFNFYTGYDPSQGYVHYVDKATAEQYGMLTAGNTSVWGVDTTMVLDATANLGRLSVRLVSKQTYNHGLFILDLVHMPINQCGTWPAFWTLGPGQWPLAGEIDIIEFSNTIPNDIMAMHTAPGCNVSGAGQTGIMENKDCGANSGFTGCGVTINSPNNIGNGFNANGGGVYAMEWTSTAIRIWYFPRNAIPPSIAAADLHTAPDIATFGVPVANFEGSCNIDTFFHDHALLFNIDFCGQWAGNTWGASGCPMLDPTNGWTSCNEFVAANPKAYTDAYWEVNSLNIYQFDRSTPVTPSSSLASIKPVISTSSVSTAVSNTQSPSTSPTSTPSSQSLTPTVPTAPIAYTPSPPATISTNVVDMCPPIGGGPEMIPCTSKLDLPKLKNRYNSPQSSGGYIGWCGVPGASCNQPTDVQNTHIKPEENLQRPREANPQTVGGGTIDWCGVPGAGCPQATESHTESLEARDAQPQDDGTIDDGTIDWCGVLGAGCPETSEFADEAGSIQPRDAQPQNDGIIDGGSIDWCGVPGAGCPGNFKISDDDLSVHAREAEPQKGGIGGGTIDWCGLPGASCNGRHVSQSQEDTNDIESREARPQDNDGGRIDWCGVPGSSCNGKHTSNAEDLDLATSDSARDQLFHGGPIEGGTFDWCGVLGANCNSRFKESGADEEISNKREAGPQGLAGGTFGWCGPPGASCNEKVEDPTALVDSLQGLTAGITTIATPSIFIDARSVEVKSVTTMHKRLGQKPTATVTCTPVINMGSGNIYVDAGCMAGQDAAPSDDVVVAQATLTIKQPAPKEPLVLGYGNVAIAGIAGTVQSNVASPKDLFRFATVMTCSCLASVVLIL